jgi:branched-chain amino acid transport system permease protein
MFHHFYGGEGGVSTDRMIDNSLLGLTYASGIQVYYLILGWTLLAAGMMLFLTHTPLGRMANATRDNFERAQFMGYDPRMVRFMQFALAGFFAGIGGGLYAITYEIVTFDALAGPLSANALLMAYIGGTGVFAGPILGAILNTVLQSWDSLLSNSWLIYVGVMFIAMVIFAPEGLAGIVLAHKPLQQRGRLGQLIVPYLRLMPAGLAVAFGFVGLVELMSFLTIGLAQGKKLTIGGNEINVFSATPWAIAIACLVIGGLWLRFEAAGFRRLWDQITAELKTGAARV